MASYHTAGFKLISQWLPQATDVKLSNFTLVITALKTDKKCLNIYEWLTSSICVQIF